MMSDTETQFEATVRKSTGSCEDVWVESFAAVELVGSRLSRQNLLTQKENVRGELCEIRASFLNFGGTGWGLLLKFRASRNPTYIQVINHILHSTMETSNNNPMQNYPNIRFHS